MIELVSTKEMKEIDQGTIEVMGVSQDVLMEKAALALKKVVLEHLPGKVLIVAGTGNNGGDGIALGRLLIEDGITPDLYITGEIGDLKPAPKLEYDRYLKYKGNVVNEILVGEYDIIVDSIFGVGLNREVGGIFADAIRLINVSHSMGTFVISADIPSGINSDTGNVMGDAVEADATVTFGYGKIGHFLDPGRQNTGKLTVDSIGMNYKLLNYNKKDVFTIPLGEQISLPPRNPAGNKGTFGRVAIIAGSPDMNGACFLSSISAFYSGTGYVEVITPNDNRNIMMQMVPEAVLFTYDTTEIDIDSILSECNKANCVVLGPGLSVNENAVKLTTEVLKNINKTLVIDADALNCIAFNNLSLHQSDFPEREIIITPHVKEFSRLTQKEVFEIKKNYMSILNEFAIENRVICVGKDSTTIVTNGNSVYINTTGNDGMATAGSGDVLSGLIGGLIAQGESAFSAAWKGVFLHGLAGDLATYDVGKYSLTASEIARTIPQAICCMES